MSHLCSYSKARSILHATPPAKNRSCKNFLGSTRENEGYVGKKPSERFREEGGKRTITNMSPKGRAIKTTTSAPAETNLDRRASNNNRGSVTIATQPPSSRHCRHPHSPRVSFIHYSALACRSCSTILQQAIFHDLQRLNVHAGIVGRIYLLPKAAADIFHDLQRFINM